MNVVVLKEEKITVKVKGEDNCSNNSPL